LRSFADRLSRFALTLTLSRGGERGPQKTLTPRPLPEYREREYVAPLSVVF